MPFNVLADLVLVAHFAFLAFVVAGGVFVLRFPKVALVHLPAVIWGALIEFFGWICPLTPLENHFRQLGGQAGYSGGFIQHYIVAVLYPDQLTRGMQFVLGTLVLFLNVFAYWRAFRRSRLGTAS